MDVAPLERSGKRSGNHANPVDAVVARQMADASVGAAAMPRLNDTHHHC
jgi:hypothetical protein